MAFHLQELYMYPCSPQIHKNKFSSVERAVFICSALYRQNKHQSHWEKERERPIIRRTYKHQNNFTAQTCSNSTCWNNILHIQPPGAQSIGKQEWNQYFGLTYKCPPHKRLINNVSHLRAHIICTRAQRSLLCDVMRSMLTALSALMASAYLTGFML